MDLKRVAIGYHRGSTSMADRFLKEALKRRDEIHYNSVKPYLNKLLQSLDSFAQEKDVQKKAEKALMYSTLFQNAVVNENRLKINVSTFQVE